MRTYILLQRISLLLLFFAGNSIAQTNKNTMTTPSQTLSITIGRPADQVYSFLSKPENFAHWAEGFAKSMESTPNKQVWSIRMANGQPAKVRFVEENNYGVVDHYVNDGVHPEVYIPLRVLANGPGSEVIFTLFRQPDMTDERFAQDRAAVQKDLGNLKRLMEKKE